QLVHVDARAVEESAAAQLGEQLRRPVDDLVLRQRRGREPGIEGAGVVAFAPADAERRRLRPIVPRLHVQRAYAGGPTALMGWSVGTAFRPSHLSLQQ